MSTTRRGADPTSRGFNAGFRVVLEIPDNRMERHKLFANRAGPLRLRDLPGSSFPASAWERTNTRLHLVPSRESEPSDRRAAGGPHDPAASVRNPRVSRRFLDAVTFRADVDFATYEGN